MMGRRDEGWALSDKIRFGEILVRAGVLERSLLENLVRERDATGMDLGELLVARGIIDEATMLQTIGKSLNRPVVGLDAARPDPRALGLLPVELCQEHLVFPVEIESSKTGDHLHVAMANPLDVRAIKVVMQQARLRIQPLVASAREIKAAIARHYAASPPVAPTPPAHMAPPPAFLSAAPTPSPLVRPPLSAPAATARPVTSGPAPSEAVFDFAVMDLSAYDEPPAPPPPAGGLFGAQPPPPAAAPRFGLSAPSSPSMAPAPADLDLARLLDSSGNEALMATAEMSRAALPPMPPAASRAPSPSVAPPPPTSLVETAPGFGVVAPRRRASVDVGPPDSPSLSGLTALPPLPGRAPAPSAQPPGAPLPGSSPPLVGPPGALGGSSSPRPLPPLPPALRQSRPGGEPGRPAGHRDSSPSLPPVGRLAEPAPPRPSDAPGGALPVGVIDHEDPADLRHILERYTQALGETRQPADELIARFVERFGAAPPAREAEALFDALARSVERQGPGLAGLVLALVQHLARRGLVDLPELVRALGQNQANQNDADRRP